MSRDLLIGGCPACGRQDCVALACKRSVGWKPGDSGFAPHLVVPEQTLTAERVVDAFLATCMERNRFKGEEIRAALMKRLGIPKAAQQGADAPEGWKYMLVESVSWHNFIRAMDDAERCELLPKKLAERWLQFDYKDPADAAIAANKEKP